MTIPVERTRAVVAGYEFLRDLLDPKKTPRVPRDIRLRAIRVLRHFPFPFQMDSTAKKCPELFGRIEP